MSTASDPRRLAQHRRPRQHSAVRPITLFSVPALRFHGYVQPAACEVGSLIAKNSAHVFVEPADRVQLLVHSYQKGALRDRVPLARGSHVSMKWRRARFEAIRHFRDRLQLHGRSVGTLSVAAEDAHLGRNGRGAVVADRGRATSIQIENACPRSGGARVAALTPSTSRAGSIESKATDIRRGTGHSRRSSMSKLCRGDHALTTAAPTRCRANGTGRLGARIPEDMLR